MINPNRMKWAGHLACMGELRNVYKIWVGKPEEKGPLRRPWHKSEDIIITDLKEIGWLRSGTGGRAL
jgi:hypothetical protein